MGLFIGYLVRTTPAWQADARLFVAVGILGGFTTFSSFSLDAIALLERGEVGAGAALCAGVGGCWDRGALWRACGDARREHERGTATGRRARRGRHAARPLVRRAFPGGDVRASAEADPHRAGADRLRAAPRPIRGSRPGSSCAFRRSRPRSSASSARSTPRTRRSCASLILYEDDELYVFNKPHGLASQGGSGTKRHMDGLLKSLPNKQGEAPRLVHRLDRDTSGVLVVAKTRAAAAHFGKVFQSRSARKIYWAIVYGNPKPAQGSISCFLAKQIVDGIEQMVVVAQNHPGAQHSMTLLLDHRRRGAALRLGDAEAGDRAHAPAARAHGAAGQPDHGRSALFQHRELPGRAGAGRGAAPARPPHPPAAALGQDHSTSARRCRRTCMQSFDALGFDADRYDVKDQDPGSE